MRHVFIVNPHAGKKRNQDALLLSIRRAFPEGGYEVLTTTGPGDAKRLAREAIETAKRAGDPVRLYACGGDGTLNEVVNAAAGVDCAAVTNVPLGTGNDFLRMFGKEGRAKFADIAALRGGPQAAYDLMECNGHYGIDVICAGVDARTAADVDRFKAMPGVTGKGAYALALVSTVAKGITRPMTVDMGPIHHNGETAILCVCNGRHYGGGFNPVPDAWPDDGVLDMLLIGDVGLKFFATQVGKYAKGRYREIPEGYVTDYHGTEVSFSSKEEIVVVIDGEVVRGHEFTVRLSEKKVNFFRPTGVEFAPPGT